MDLTALINVYRGPLIGFLAARGAPWADAVELAQDSIAEAWLRRESCRRDCREPAVFGRWLRGVALNRYRNWARSRRRLRSWMVTLEPAVLDEYVAPADPETTDDLDALRRAIARLPARQRQAVLMHYLEETSVNEVAALLSVSAKAVEGRLYQARRTLRRLLGETPAASRLGRMLPCL
jgi:RNA polymerase sigma-70 factor (ECF subfamily)